MGKFGIRIVFDRKGETKKNPKEPALVHIEITDKDTKRKRYITTGVKILANQYSTNGGFSIKNHPNAFILKARVKNIYDEVEAFLFSDRCKSFDDIYKWNKEVEVSMTFLEFFEQEMGRKSQSGISDDSWKNHRTLFSALNRFGKIVLFKDLTYTNLIDFDAFLKQTIKSQPVIYKRHQMLKSYIVEAIKRGLTTQNPYDDYKCKKGKSKPRLYLDEAEIKKMLECPVLDDKMQRVKDMYIFQCFTGLAFADMQNFNKNDISVVEDYKVIRSSRIKTDETFIALLLPEAEEVAERYNYCLPKISNQKYNDYIKLLANKADIDKKLTSHTIRHRNHSFLQKIRNLQNIPCQ